DARRALTRMARQRSARGSGSTENLGGLVEPPAPAPPSRTRVSSPQVSPKVSPNRVSQCKRRMGVDPSSGGKCGGAATCHGAVDLEQSGLSRRCCEVREALSYPAQYLPSTPSLQHACGPKRILKRATNVCMCRLPISALNGPPGAVPPVTAVKRSPEKSM